MAIFLSSTVVSDEIDKKTVLTVLCKPVRRVQFIFGKYLGIFLAILGGYIALSIVLLAAVWHFETPVYYIELIKAWISGAELNAHQLYAYTGENRKVIKHAGNAVPFSVILTALWSDAAYFGGTVFPKLLAGVFLSLCEVGILASAALAISTRVSMIPNVCLTFMLFILGHQSGYLVHLLTGKEAGHGLLTTLLLRIIPNFEFLNYASDIAFGKEVPLSLVGMLLLYAAAWVGMFLLVAQVLFEQRELA
jgi:ABC-type transport system involved in multi-copper enzyme maturation permease subunit